MGFWREPSSWLTDGCPLAVSSHGKERGSSDASFSSYRLWSHGWWGSTFTPSSKPNYPLKAPCPNTSMWGVRASTYAFGVGASGHRSIHSMTITEISQTFRGPLTCRSYLKLHAITTLFWFFRGCCGDFDSWDSWPSVWTSTQTNMPLLSRSGQVSSSDSFKSKFGLGF